MQRKIFWITFAALGLVADLALPLWWAVAATIPIVFASWWIAYRSDWFWPLMTPNPSTLSGTAAAILDATLITTSGAKAQ